MTNENITNIVDAMSAQRPKFQIDASPRIINAVKAEAYSRGLTLRQFVLKAIAKESPKLKEIIDDEVD